MNNNKFTDDYIEEKLFELNSNIDRTLTFKDLKTLVKTDMDENLISLLEQEESLYSYLMTYNLETKISKLEDPIIKSLKTLDNQGLILTSEFIKIILVRTMTNNPSLKDIFSKYIEELDLAINNFLTKGKENELLAYILPLLKNLDISFEFFLNLNIYFKTIYKEAIASKTYKNIDINFLESLKLDKYHDFNIIGYFKEDEKGFFENILNNLNHDYGEGLIKETLKDMDNSGVLLVGGLFDAFLYNLKRKDKKFTSLYNIISSANSEYIKGLISEYNYNIIVGYIVMGLRYSFQFYIGLKDYTNYLYNREV